MDWLVTAADIDAIALGAGVLGTGGGGNPYLGRLHLLQHLRRGAAVRIIPADQVDDDALGCAVGGMGAPTVGIEKLPAGHEMVGVVRALETDAGRPFSFLACGEIGGANSLQPLIAAAQTGLPVVDGDPMGRAFPELQMDTFMIGGVSPSPLALRDAHGNTVVVTEVLDPFWAERIGRAVTIAVGGTAALGLPLLTGAEIKRHVIRGTYTLARRLGRAVLEADRRGLHPVASLLQESGGLLLFVGKITDVDRRTTAGFARGVVRLEAVAHDLAGEKSLRAGAGEAGGVHGAGEEGCRCEIEFQNEFLIARVDGNIAAVTPDLICLVDADTAQPIGTEVLRYGLRVAVIGIGAPPQLKTPEALAVVGPRGFGYDLDFAPLAAAWPGGAGASGERGAACEPGVHGSGVAG
ncbi:MAG TPA: DUF917 domain-containing protein [Bacillota bacterium]